ncbi:hypothetical protein [Rugosibacter aromaticivorans]|uniref:hypothetical protein n=1 Tax=Rugosibacter aromaticivorans TaxID=1565605 RepID=UPI00192A1B23|nr:hypothetical protein [Rugosibacter aromaticivorans]
MAIAVTGSAKVGAGRATVGVGAGISTGAASNVGVCIGKGLRAMGRGFGGTISGFVCGASSGSRRTLMATGALGWLMGAYPNFCV